MALNFPSNPSENDIYQFGLLTYIFKNGKWVSQSRGASQLPWYSNELNHRAMWERLCAEAGLVLVAGSFEEGGTINATNEVLWWKTGASIFAWGTNEAKTVPANSTPATSGGIGSGAWVDRTDTSLLSLLLNGDIALKAPTQVSTDSSTNVATTAFVAGAIAALSSDYATPEDITSAINSLIGNAPEALDTLNELANALANDAAFSTTVLDLIATKANKIIPINRQTVIAYTLALSDYTSGAIIEMNNSSVNTVTIPPNSSVAFPVGAVILVRQLGAGATTIVAGSGVTINNAHATAKLYGRYASATIHQRATNVWVLEGNFAAS